MTAINKLIFFWSILVMLFTVTLVMACVAPYASHEQDVLAIVSTSIGAVAMLIVFPIIVWMILRDMDRTAKKREIRRRYERSSTGRATLEGKHPGYCRCLRCMVMLQARSER